MELSHWLVPFQQSLNIFRRCHQCHHLTKLVKVAFQLVPDDIIEVSIVAHYISRLVKLAGDFLQSRLLRREIKDILAI